MHRGNIPPVRGNNMTDLLQHAAHLGSDAHGERTALLAILSCPMPVLRAWATLLALRFRGGV